MNAPVSWAGLGVSLLLVAVAAGISWWQRLGLQRQILIAAARALVQLLLVGAALTLVISPGRSIWWSWLWVAAMLAYAATVAHRVHPRERGRRPPVGRDRALAPAALVLLAGLVLLVACGFMLAWELGTSGVTAP